MPSQKPLFPIRIDSSIMDKIKIIADKEVRTTTGQIEFILRKFIDDYEKQNGLIKNWSIFFVFLKKLM